MTKAILVIDMPRDCDECMFSDCFYNCKFLGDVDESAVNGCRDLRCPLKEMPKKKEIEEKEGMWAVLSSIAENYEDGWNDCIDSILGEE